MTHQSPKTSPLILTLLGTMFLSPLAACTSTPQSNPSRKSIQQQKQEYKQLISEHERAVLTQEYVDYARRATKILRQKHAEEEARREEAKKWMERHNPDLNIALLYSLEQQGIVALSSEKPKKRDLISTTGYRLKGKADKYKNKLKKIEKYLPVTIEDVDLDTIEYQLLKTNTCVIQGEIKDYPKLGGATFTIEYKTTAGLEKPIAVVKLIPEAFISWFGEAFSKGAKPTIATSLP